MNTAGGNDARHEWEKWLDALKEQAARDGASLRDPSVRDVLAQLDRIETKLDALMKPVLYVGQTPPDTEAETK